VRECAQLDFAAVHGHLALGANVGAEHVLCDHPAPEVHCLLFDHEVARVDVDVLLGQVDHEVVGQLDQVVVDLEELAHGLLLLNEATHVGLALDFLAQPRDILGEPWLLQHLKAGGAVLGLFAHHAHDDQIEHFVGLVVNRHRVVSFDFGDQFFGADVVLGQVGSLHELEDDSECPNVTFLVLEVLLDNFGRHLERSAAAGARHDYGVA